MPIGATKRVLGAGAIPFVEEQHAQVKWRPAMTTLIGSPKCVLGAGAVSGLRQQHPESVGGLGVATLIRVPERIAGPDTVVLPEEENGTSKRRSAFLLIVTAIIGLAARARRLFADRA